MTYQKSTYCRNSPHFRNGETILILKINFENERRHLRVVKRCFGTCKDQNKTYLFHPVFYVFLYTTFTAYKSILLRLAMSSIGTAPSILLFWQI
jgi:hypothetical protein